MRTGVLAEDKMKLDYVLALKPEDFLERRLQTQVSEPPITRQPCSTTADLYTSGFNFAPIFWRP